MGVNNDQIIRVLDEQNKAIHQLATKMQKLVRQAYDNKSFIAIECQEIDNIVKEMDDRTKQIIHHNR